MFRKISEDWLIALFFIVLFAGMGIGGWAGYDKGVQQGIWRCEYAQWSDGKPMSYNEKLVIELFNRLNDRDEGRLYRENNNKPYLTIISGKNSRKQLDTFKIWLPPNIPLPMIEIKGTKYSSKPPKF